VAVLLEEVVLDFPDVVEAEFVGEFDLLECVLQQLVLLEDSELHLANSGALLVASKK
jgi:hypothetical protein